MSKRMQIYYNAVFGGLGGLLGWWSMGSLNTAGTWNIWLASVVIGAGMGASISALVAAMEGTMIKRSPLRALLDATKGALAGAAGGVLGLALGQLCFLLLGGGFVGRPVGWMLLGLFVGLGEFSISRKLRRASYGALGGLVGGLVGGLFYEGLTQLFIAQSDEVQSWVGGFGLVLMGACIGSLIALTRQVLSRGELRVLSGRREGTVREVTDSVSLGRSDACDVYLPDPALAARHAIIRRTSNGFSIMLSPEATQGAIVGGQAVGPAQERSLRNGDVIQFGGTHVQFIGR
jgi:hypothetical protein